jgi:hypothetical protein
VSRFKDRVLWFIGEFGRVPEEDLPTPRPQRTPFFIGMVAIAIVVLVLLVILVVIPGIRAQQSPSRTPAAVPAK